MIQAPEETKHRKPVNLPALSLNDAEVCNIRGFLSPVKYSNTSDKLLYKANIIFNYCQNRGIDITYNMINIWLTESLPSTKRF